MQVKLDVILSDDIRVATRELSTLKRQAVKDWDRRVYNAARRVYVHKFGRVPFDDSQDDLASGWWWYRHYLKKTFTYADAGRVVEHATARFLGGCS